MASPFPVPSHSLDFFSPNIEQISPASGIKNERTKPAVAIPFVLGTGADTGLGAVFGVEVYEVGGVSNGSALCAGLSVALPQCGQNAEPCCISLPQYLQNIMTSVCIAYIYYILALSISQDFCENLILEYD